MHEAEWSKLPSDRTLVDVVPNDLAIYMLSDWEDHQPKKKAMLSKSDALSASVVPNGLAEYFLCDFEAHEKDWEIPESRTSIDQVTEALADFMGSEWEAQHEEEKKSSTPLKIGDLSKKSSSFPSTTMIRLKALQL